MKTLYEKELIFALYSQYQRKSTEGLAVLTFILAVFGNLTYGGQILFRDLSKEFILEKTPWLVGSLGVIGLDLTVSLKLEIL